jgi:hypothetical protein
VPLSYLLKDRKYSDVPRPTFLLESEILDLYKIIESLQSHALRTLWMGREIDKITAMGYFIVVVSIFILAELIIPGFLDEKFLVNFKDIPEVRNIVLIFSSLALIGVSAMLLMRLKELQSKAWTTFSFLIEQDGIKIMEEKLKEHFDKSLQTIERYLNDGNWTLAEYWTKRVAKEYDDFINREWFEKKEN